MDKNPSKTNKLTALVWFAVFMVALFLAYTCTKIAIGVGAFTALPTVYEVGNGVAVFDRNNRHISTVYADRDSIPVPFSKMSINIKRAALAAEDHHFYEHHGIDPSGIGRAAVSNMRAGHVTQGGSTITQQLVRNLYLDPQDRSFKRKVMEAVLSLDVELNNSKARILETYLNDIYFGRGVYGIERAANTFFNKHAANLSVGEAAFIAGLIRAPSGLSDPKHLDAALDRQHQVLDAMVEAKYISAQDAEKIKQQRLAFRKGAVPEQPYPYYVNYVVQLLKTQFSDKQLWGSGLRVYTNLDPKAQQAAQKFLSKGIQTAPAGINQGALVSISLKDGGVLALVGGVGDYRSHQWNRATHVHTAGSAFKPFVYLTGLMAGVLQTNTMLDDSPITIDMGFGQKYSPKNFDGRYLGPITVRTALTLSRNVCSIRIAQAVGPDKIIQTARSAGITSPLDNNLPLALGGCAVSPLELANAYATLARDGMFMPSQLIREVDNAQGQSLQKYTPKQERVLPSEQTRELVDVLQDVVQKGTGTQAKLPNIAVAGKTGTADKARDIWFVGFTPDTVTAVWGGNDNYRAVSGNVTGGTVMAKIWHDYMADFYKQHPAPKVSFVPPATPLARQSTPINATVLNEIQQYEDGVKPADSQLPQSGEQPPPEEGSTADQLDQVPPFAPPIENWRQAPPPEQREQQIPLHEQIPQQHEQPQPETAPSRDYLPPRESAPQHESLPREPAPTSETPPPAASERNAEPAPAPPVTPPQPVERPVERPPDGND